MISVSDGIPQIYQHSHDNKDYAQMHRLTSALLTTLQVSCSFYEFAPYILGRKFLFRQHAQVTLGVFFHLRQLLFPLIHIDICYD